jgi:hypothetical protein
LTQSLDSAFPNQRSNTVLSNRWIDPFRLLERLGSRSRVSSLELEYRENHSSRGDVVAVLACSPGLRHGFIDATDSGQPTGKQRAPERGPLIERTEANTDAQMLDALLTTPLEINPAPSAACAVA